MLPAERTWVLRAVVWPFQSPVTGMKVSLAEAVGSTTSGSVHGLRDSAGSKTASLG
jgi:hypothetical protein